MWKEILLVVIGILEALWLLKLDKFTIQKYKKYTGLALVYFISVAITYMLLIRINWLDEVIRTSSSPIIEKFILILISIVISLIYSPIYVAIMQKMYERKLIKKYENNTEVMKYDYYRDIIKNVSPAILAYSCNKKVDIQDTIVAILLSLQLREYIKIENSEIHILKDMNEILSHEKLVVDNLLNKKYNEKSFRKKFKYSLKEDMTSKGYITTEKEDDANITYFMEMISAWLIIYIISTIIIFVLNSSLGLYLFAFYFFVSLSMPIYKFIQSKIDVVIRSKEMLELGAKIAGVKNYIKDYSNISNNSIDMVNLYGEFVVYAIILNIKGQLDDECKNMYQSIKDTYCVCK